MNVCRQEVTQFVYVNEAMYEYVQMRTVRVGHSCTCVYTVCMYMPTYACT